ncbi:MAG: hypothetical protein GQ540_01665 [Lutibacter sp.]|uniref:hypothetical protein n=1 Tax=Lutibacter sp. TaxID=1925666 RepID=UPI001A03F597|nr:hypothetical protein [Lutibacter sp.]NOR27215.1 hypothetical protein [Lutibacter sp.]
MKISNLKLLAVLFVSATLLISCNNNDDEAVNVSEQISIDEAIAVAEADDVSDEVDNLLDDFFVATEGLSKSTETESKVYDFLPCLTKTIVLTETTKTVTLDFGEGCELPSGNVLSGKIIMSHAIDTDVHSLTITHTYENFYFNEINIEGGNSIVRVRENENGNPKSTITFNTTLTWPDGVFASREGAKAREWIEGYDTRTFGDNVFLITGNWSATFKDGTVVSANALEPLRREMACRFIVSGVLELEKGDRVGTLDFGDGSCDNIAILTNQDGEEFEVTLRGRMF